MKLRIASLTLLCLALSAIPAWAQNCRDPNWCYDNGPINGGTNAWQINSGYIVSDTFYAGSYYPDLYVFGFAFGVWEVPGDVMSSVGWSITAGENSGAVAGSGVASGANLTDQFLSNQYGYDIDLITVKGLYVGLTPNSTYWLNLYNAVVTNGDPVYWDENSGVGCGGSDGKGAHCPSLASENSVGTIASEAFTISGLTGYPPEPSSIVLFGSGILGVAGVLRRKLHF